LADMLATLIVHAGSSRWYLFPRMTAQRAHFVACSEEVLRCGLRSHRGGSSSIAFTLSSPPGSCVSFLLTLTHQHSRNNTRVASFSLGQLGSLAFDTVPSSRLRSTPTLLPPARLPSAPPPFASFGLSSLPIYTSIEARDDASVDQVLHRLGLERPFEHCEHGRLVGGGYWE
jgi:hypothetical protein